MVTALGLGRFLWLGLQVCVLQNFCSVCIEKLLRLQTMCITFVPYQYLPDLSSAGPSY